MEALVVIGIIVVVGIVVRSVQRSNKQHMAGRSSRSSSGSYRKAPAGRPAAASQPPAVLGVPEGHPAWQAAQRLEYALTADFEARVKDRVLKNEPGMSERDWQWRWFELKRYFLMCGVLRNVPMYSAKVDDVWHEMLMFTREYEQFCKSFSGTFIHHAPHAPGAKPDPAERAWFDWVYGELFAIFPASAQLWGAFYRTPLSRERIGELELVQADELRASRFNAQAAEAYPDLNGTIHYLMDRGRQLARDARSEVRRDANYTQSRTDYSASDPMMMTGLLSGALFFSSMGPSDEFDRHMEEAQTEEQRQANAGSGGGASSCGAYGDGDSDRDHGSDGNDGSSCGSSGAGDGGGSSGGDGGGCSSGCGGGCSS